MVTSGIRIGTPAVTSRGNEAGRHEADSPGYSLALGNPEQENRLDEAREIVAGLCDKYPLYK